MQYSVTPELTIIVLWIVWLVSWIAASVWTSRTEKRAGIGAELFFRVLFYGGAILMFGFPPGRHYFAQVQLWQLSDALNWMVSR